MKPICVDLDGTLIRDDVTIEAFKIFTRQNFFNLFKIFVWFLQGRAHLKKKLAANVDLDVSTLQYNKNFLDFLITKKSEGHKLFLATACDQSYADKIADSLKIFDGVFASNGVVNLRAEAKVNALVMIFGEGRFIYAGNSKDDVHVWNKSAECILVSPTKSALEKMKNKKYTLFQ